MGRHRDVVPPEHSLGLVFHLKLGWWDRFRVVIGQQPRVLVEMYSKKAPEGFRMQCCGGLALSERGTTAPLTKGRSLLKGWVVPPNDTEHANAFLRAGTGGGG